MAEEGNILQREESSIVKRELFPEEGTSVDMGRKELSLLIKITQGNGESLPYGTVNDQLIIELFQNNVGSLPTSILVLNDQDALVDFANGTAVLEMAQAIHGPARYRDLDINIGCLMSTRELLINVEREREEIRMQKDDLEREKEELEAREEQTKETMKQETEEVQSRFLGYQTEMNELNRRVKESLQLLETTRQAAEREMYQRSFSGTSRDNFFDGNKINKPPTFPTFSGAEPTPKDECSIQTFLFQVRSARQDVTDQAVRNALISSLRGPASEFVEYIGLTAPLETIIKEMEERYVRTTPPDTLVCEFHQLHQDKRERVKEFASRIEKLFKKLVDQLPERYPDRSLLKDRLFYGMQQHLRDSLRFMFQDPKCDYTQLLKAASAAEIESERGRALGIHSKGGNLVEDDQAGRHPNRDVSPITASVASMESKLEQLTTIVKSAQKMTNAENSKSGSLTPKNTPKKTGGPTTTSAGPFHKGKKPIRCWRCGGWGHVSRECSTQGNLNWKELNGSKDLPSQVQTQSPKTK